MSESILGKRSITALLLILQTCSPDSQAESCWGDAPNRNLCSVIHEISIEPNSTTPDMSIPKISSVAWNTDGSHLALGAGWTVMCEHYSFDGIKCTYSGVVQIFDITGVEPVLLHTLTTEDGKVGSLAYNHDSTLLVVGLLGNRGLLLFYDPNNEYKHLGSKCLLPIGRFVFNRDGTRLGLAAVGGVAKIFNLTHCAPTHSLVYGEWCKEPYRCALGIESRQFQSSIHHGIDYKPDGTEIAFGSVLGHVWVCRSEDLQSCQRISNCKSLPSHEKYECSVSRNPPEVEAEKTKISGTGWDFPVTGLAYNPNGNQLAAGFGSTNPVVRIFDPDNLSSPPLKLTGNAKYLQSITYNHDGTRLAGGYKDNVLIYSSSTSGPPIITLYEEGVIFSSVAFNHDDSLLAAGGWGKDAGKVLIYGTKADANN